MITTTIPCLRDPFIVVEDNAYYAYGTGWHCYKNAGDDLAGPWEDLGEVAQLKNPADAGDQHWAPEVHKYKGAYYMFTTYNRLSTGRRGCTVLKSDTPEFQINRRSSFNHKTLLRLSINLHNVL